MTADTLDRVLREVAVGGVGSMRYTGISIGVSARSSKESAQTAGKVRQDQKTHALNPALTAA